MQTFGQRIKKARIGKGMSMDVLGKKIRSHKGYISGIENDKVSPPHWALTRRLCRVLGLPEDEMQILGWAQKAPAVVKGRILEILQNSLTYFGTAP